MRVWLIDGSPDGIARDAARVALSTGDHVVVTREQAGWRRRFEDDHTHRLHLVGDFSDHPAVALARFSRIDVVLVVGELQLTDGVEEATDDEVLAVFDASVVGPLRVLRAALP